VIRVELDPLGGHHEVNVALILEAPVLEHLFEVELADHLVRGQQRVHVGIQPNLCVPALLVEFDLDEGVGVGSNDEVDLGPVNHDHFLHVVHYIWQLLLVYFLDALVVLTGLEVAEKDFVLVQPLSFEHLVCGHLVGVVVAQVRQNVILLFLVAQETVFVLPLELVHPKRKRLLVQVVDRLLLL